MTILVKPLLFYLFNVVSTKHYSVLLYAGFSWTIHRPRADSFRTHTYANPRGGSGLWREIWSPRHAVYAKHTHPALALTTRCSETRSTRATPGSCRPAAPSGVCKARAPRHAKHTGRAAVRSQELCTARLHHRSQLLFVFSSGPCPTFTFCRQLS